MRRSRKRPKPFCAYTMLAFVFLFLIAKLFIHNNFGAKWSPQFSCAAFSQSCLYAASFCSTIVLRKTVKTRKAADRDFSGALFNQNFLYSAKNLTRCVFRQTGQNALRFSRSRYSFFGRRTFSQNRP